jgi:hypothetical protein
MIVASDRLFARFETGKERKQQRRAWGGLLTRASRYKAQKQHRE